MAGLVPAIPMRIAPYLPCRDRRDEPGDDIQPYRKPLYNLPGPSGGFAIFAAHDRPQRGHLAIEKLEWESCELGPPLRADRLV
jgi:hypothetical protein